MELNRDVCKFGYESVVFLLNVSITRLKLKQDGMIRIYGGKNSSKQKNTQQVKLERYVLQGTMEEF